MPKPFKDMLSKVKNLLKVLGEGSDMMKTIGYSGDIKIMTPNIKPNYVFEDVDMYSKIILRFYLFCRYKIYNSDNFNNLYLDLFILSSCFQICSVFCYCSMVQF